MTVLYECKLSACTSVYSMLIELTTVNIITLYDYYKSYGQQALFRGPLFPPSLIGHQWSSFSITLDSIIQSLWQIICLHPSQLKRKERAADCKLHPGTAVCVSEFMLMTAFFTEIIREKLTLCIIGANPTCNYDSLIVFCFPLMVLAFGDFL